MKLNQTLLNIICAVQDCKKFETSKSLLEQCKGDSSKSYDWFSKVEVFFYSLDKVLIEQASIKKNRSTFEKILTCKIPDAAYDTEYCDLGMFEVSI